MSSSFSNDEPLAFRVARSVPGTEWVEERRSGNYVQLRPATQAAANEVAGIAGKSSIERGRVVVFPAWKDNAKAIRIGGTEITLNEFALAVGFDLAAERRKGPKGDLRPYTVIEWLQSRKIPTTHDEQIPVDIGPHTTKAGHVSETNRRLRFHYDGDQVSYRRINLRSRRVEKVTPWEFYKADVAPFFTYVNEHVPDPTPDTLWWCEGPIDQICMAQYGFTAVAIPSASVSKTQFQRERWASLTERVAQRYLNCKRWVFAFDAGTAGQKAIRNALQLTAKFCRDNKIEIATLRWPEGTEDGVDLNDLAKQHEDLFPDALLRLVTDPLEAVASEPVEANDDPNVVWIEKPWLARTPSGYQALNGSDAGHMKLVSNCTLDVTRFYRDDENVASVRVNIKSHGRAHEAVIPTEEFADAGTFRRRIQKYGLTHFAGATNKMLPKILEFEATEAQANEVRVVRHIGWHDWGYILGDGVISNGKFEAADDNGVITFDDTRWELDPDYNFYGVGRFPCFNVAPLHQSTAADFAEAMRTLIAEDYVGWLVLGWAVAAFYRDCIWSARIGLIDRSFPFLMLKGPKQCGKSQTISRIMALFGLQLVEGNDWSESTPNFIAKSLERNRSIPPTWMEEVATTGKGAGNWGTLKSAFTGAAPGKGTKTGTTRLTVNGTLILTGEELVPELASRSVLVDMPHGERRTLQNRRSFLWLGENQEQITALGREIMLRRTANPNAAADYVGKVTKWHGLIMGANHALPARLAQNMSIVAAALEQFPHELDVHGDFTAFLFEYMRIEPESADVIAQGLDMYLGQPGQYAWCKLIDDRRILAIPSARMEAYLQRVHNFPVPQFVEAMKKVPYNILSESSRKTGEFRVPETDGRHPDEWMKDVGKTTKCWKLDYDSELLPEFARYQNVMFWHAPLGEGGRWQSENPWRNKDEDNLFDNAQAG